MDDRGTRFLCLIHEEMRVTAWLNMHNDAVDRANQSLLISALACILISVGLRAGIGHNLAVATVSFQKVQQPGFRLRTMASEHLDPPQSGTRRMGRGAAAY